MRTGTYTGNGSDTGREIDLGSEPDHLTIIRSDTGTAALYEAAKLGVDAAHNVTGGTLTTNIEMTTEVYTSANGFTVGDGGTSANVDGQTYIYTAWYQ